MSVQGCKGCGAELPASLSNRPRVWCSERCRKGSYGDPCVECGARTVYGAETGRRGEDPRCAACARRRASDRRVSTAMSMLALRRTSDMTNREIASTLGIPWGTVATELHRLRCLGFEFPASPYNGRGATDHRGTDLVWDEPTHSLAAALRDRGHEVPVDRERAA